jgi:pantoate--beta-alanine ligase
MVLFKKVDELINELEILRKRGLTIGFVPTMGALHKGHLSLIEYAANENDAVIVSIFVNPTQFNNSEDLKKYPRNLDKDLEFLEGSGCKIVFAPSENEIYPDEKSKKSNFEFGKLTKVMEGKFRPSHFEGVATVVRRLFEIVRPTKAYFGQKDIQQFLVINYLNNNYLSHFKISLVKCPIIREPDGLAMSSRNMLLDNKQRESSVLISRTIFSAQKNYRNFSVDELKNWVIDTINKDRNLKVEYFEIVNDPDLNEIHSWSDNKKILACIAVFAGNIRLIDNVYFN